MATETTDTEKVYCTGCSPLETAALLNSQNNNGMNNPMAMMAMANGNGGFGGQWNNPFVYLIWIYMMRWMNGWGNGSEAADATALNYNNRQISELRSTVDNNHNNDLVMQAIQGNGAAIHELANTFNADYNTLSQAICGIKSAITEVGGQVGYSAEKVINAVNMGDSNIISTIQSTACATQRTILDSTNTLQNAITNGSYQSQLATERQTNQLGSQIASFQSANQLQNCQNNGALISRIDQLANGITQGFSQVGYAAAQNTQAIINAQTASTQRILDQMCANNTQELRDKLAQLSQTAQTAEIVARLGGGCNCNS